MIDGLDTWGPEVDKRCHDTGLMANHKPFEVRYVVLDPNLIISKISPAVGEEYDKHEQSILAEGFRNPIIVVAKDKIYCLTIGGTRLSIATKHGLSIPCIVSDYVGRFKNEPLIKNVNEMLEYYKDKPLKIIFVENGLSYIPKKD